MRGACDGPRRQEEVRELNLAGRGVLIYERPGPVKLPLEPRDLGFRGHVFSFDFFLRRTISSLVDPRSLIYSCRSGHIV